jgi:hypothetical protein
LKSLQRIVFELSGREWFSGVSRALLFALVLMLLSACTSMSEATYKTLKAALVSHDSSSALIQDSGIAPAFKTMRVLTAQTQSILVLGEIEQSPDGEIEVWFSGQGEILRIQNGKIVSTAGLAINWVRSRYKVIEHDRLANRTVYRVTRDVMPGWRYGYAQEMSQSPLAAPPASVARWFDGKERTAELAGWTVLQPTDRRQADQAWQVAYFGHNHRGQTRAGYQCLAPDLCLGWEKLR